MSRTRTTSALVGVVTSALLVATGCASSAPGAETPAPGTESPSASPAAEPSAPAALLFSGSDLRSLDEDAQTLDTAEFAAGAGATVELLAAVLGAPTTTEVGEECAAAQTLYEWHGVSLSEWDDSFSVSIGAATSGDVSIQTTGGYSVGDDMSSLIPTLDAEDVARPPGAGSTFVALDVVSSVTHGDYTSPLGAIGYLEDSATLTSVITPGEWSSFLC
jgi:hypothetical protein